MTAVASTAVTALALTAATVTIETELSTGCSNFQQVSERLFKLCNRKF